MAGTTKETSTRERAARNRVLWYGGLAALAALDVVEWPVAAVVAAGSYVAEQRARSVLRPHGAEARGKSSS